MKNRDFNPFNRIRVDAPNQNSFDLSFDNKLTTDMGLLTPVMVQDTLPGDYFKIQPEMYLKFAPLLYPIMHKIDATVHFFYVPNRILWNNWEKFLAGEDYHPLYFQGDDTILFTVEESSIFDYMGLPLTTNLKEKISAFPYLAMLSIYNQYYQDQNNDDLYQAYRDALELFASMNGKIAATDFDPAFTNYSEISGLSRRAWQHDYFTSALQWAQKGQAVTIPLELQDLPVTSAYIQRVAGGDPAAGNILSDGNGFMTDITPDLVQIEGIADASGALITGTINELRTAYQLQKFLEKNARSGTRYNELIMAHFGQSIGDARINRPEYIGGIKNNIVISEVLQTSSTTDSSALGDYAGHATGLIGGNPISYQCPEHGFIIGVLSVMPSTAYFQGINRKFTRFNYLDYPWPDFAHIGEQAILNKELYYDPALTDNNNTFGYIPRYSECKYNPSEVHGAMRTSLLSFHLARKFASRPALTSEFVYCDPSKRVFAVEDEETNSLYAHLYFKIHAKRKIPFFTDPGAI